MKNTLAETWEELPMMIRSSAVSSAGRDEILDFIDGINNEFTIQ
jgi:hypothetical protein